jgi:TolB-like protein/tetratricopeptide (TPR) repeat protein/DNA-binding winged helix-turn-helix (wHTH) protein
MGPSTSASPTPEPSGYRVGDLVIDMGRQRVTRAGVELPLSQLSFELLLALARAAPNLLSLDQLMERVWPSLVISPETVSQRVKLVRDALADDSAAPRYIAGVRGRGYRMVAPVSPVGTLASSDPLSDTPPSAAASVVPTVTDSTPRAHPLLAGSQRGKTLGAALTVLVLAISLTVVITYLDRPPKQGSSAESDRSVLVQQPRTIAVLPLVDLSPSGGNDYLADGLAQELSSRLARIPGLRVASQTSSFAYKGSRADVRAIGKALDVRHIVEGSIRREGDHIRVTAELVDATSGYHVWSQSYDRKWQDLLVIQDDLSRSIISTLQLVLASDLAQRVGQPPTAKVAAFNLYLSGIGKLPQPAGLGQLDGAEEMFRDALAIDPRFAPAYAGLCERYTMGYEASRDPALATKAESACKQALQIDGTLREVEMGLAHLYLVTGRAERAAVLLHSVISKDPTDPDAYIGLADAYEGQHKTTEAEIAYGRAVEVEPSYAEAHVALGNFLTQHGRAAAAVPHLKRVTELVPASTAAYNDLGGALLMSGDFQAAATAFQRSLQLAPTRSAYSNSGTVYYFLNRFADAEQMFRKATEMAAEDHRVWGNLADALYQIPGRQAEAAQQYRHAIELAERRVNVTPTDGATWSQLAFYHARIGEGARSVPCLSRALALDADDVFVQYYAALTELEQHDTERALALLHRAIELGYPTLMVRAAPDFAAIVHDERFQQVLAAANRP